MPLGGALGVDYEGDSDQKCNWSTLSGRFTLYNVVIYDMRRLMDNFLAKAFAAIEGTVNRSIIVTKETDSFPNHSLFRLVCRPIERDT